MNERPLAVFFAKKPEPGQVKTRLSPPLDPLAASELYHCVLQDLFHRFGRQKGGFHLGVAFAPKEGRGYFERITPAGTQFFLQRGEELPQRIGHFFEEAFAQGFGPIVILGSDVPFLDVGRVQIAFEMLASNADVVIGPEHGGGYYLLGTKRHFPVLFTDGSGFRRGALEAQMRAESQGLKALMLPTELDLDYPDDLLRLVELVIRRPKLAEEIPSLVHFLKELGYFTEVTPRKF